MIFFKNRTNFELGDKLSPVFQHGFLGSEENVTVNKFLHLEGVLVFVCPVIFWTLVKLTNFPKQMLCHNII